MADSMYERFYTSSDGGYPFCDEEGSGDIAVSEQILVGATSLNQDHVVTKVEVSLKKTGTPPNDIIVEIREFDTATNAPKTEVMATSTIAKASVGAAFAWVDCGFTEYVTLRASTKYCIILKSAGLTDGGNDYIWDHENTAGIYGTYNTSGDYGNTWSANSNANAFWFRITGGFWDNTVIDYNELIRIVGSGANATAKSVTNASIYAGNAEGYVNAITRYDWGTNWATCNAKAKKLVKEAMMCLAAVDIVNYSTLGYQSRFEAQYISNSLQARSDKAIGALMNINISDYTKKL